MKVTYPLKQLTFLLFVKLVIGYYKRMIIVILLFTQFPLIVDTSPMMALNILQFYVIFFGGLLLSFIIHEYIHALCLKKSRKDGEVEIEFSFARITLYPKFKLTSKEMIKVAILPIIILPLIGLVIVLLAKWTNQTFILISGYLYILHVINIIPPLGDGLMIIKAIINKAEDLKGGEKSWH